MNNKKKKSLIKRAASFRVALMFLITAQSLPLSALALPAPTSAPVKPATANSTPVSGSSGLRNFDLSSTKATVTAAKSGTVVIGGHLAANGTISGGTRMSVAAGQLLTPSINSALWQSITGGVQHLLINPGGAAMGGYANLRSSWSSSLSSLVVPKGVAVDAIGFNKSSPLNVSNASTILGSVYTLQNSAGLTALLNFGNNLSIGSGALLSGELPKGMNASGLFASQHMTLNVLGNFSNNGTVSVPGNLNLNVIGVLGNTTRPGTSTATLSAQNINISSASGNIVNSGLISALHNININTMNVTTDLNINGVGGTFQALHDINLRDSSYAGSNNIYMLGGNYLSQNLNLYSGTGTINAITNQVSGKLNTVAGVEHFAADTPLLTICNNTISGDPTFANTGGDILISGLNTFGEDVAILAAGNVTADANGAIVANSHNITLVAGAGLSVTGSGGVSVPTTTISGGTGPSILQNGDVAIVNFSTSSIGVTPGGTGGDIDLSASNAATIIDSSAAAASGKNGGNITLAAFANGSTGGNIFLNTASKISSSGDGVGHGGNVNIYAGASPAVTSNTIAVGDISTGGAGASGSGFGSVNIFTAQPDGAGIGVINTHTVTFDSSGAISSPSSIVSSNSLAANASIRLANITTASTGGSTILAGGKLKLSGNINTNGGGLLLVAGEDVVSINSGISINTSNTAGNGGTLSIFAGADSFPSTLSGTVTLLGSVTGGSIDLNSTPINGISSKSSAATGNGGNTTLAAFAGGPGSGKILLPFNSTVASGGNGDAGPGFIFVIAGASTGDALIPGISIGNLDSTGGFHIGQTGLAGGHQVISTEQPGVSPANPLVIDLASGAPLQGGVLGGATASSPIVARSIKTGGGQIIAFSGLGITVGDGSTIGSTVISTAPQLGPTHSIPGGMITILANAAGSNSQAADITINGNMSSAGDINTLGAGPIAMLTTGNITAGNIAAGNSSTTGKAASIYIVAGGPGSDGLITLGSIDTTSASPGTGGDVQIISMGSLNPLTAGTILIAANAGTSINTSSQGNAGAVTISSPGPITLAGDILATGTKNGGSVFIASGLLTGAVAGQHITVGAINTATTGLTAQNFAGGVYLLTVAPNTIAHGTITQTQSSGSATQRILSYAPTRTNILGGDGTVTLDFDSSVTPAEYSPGGYNNIDDQTGTPGNVQIALIVGNNEPNLMVPLISLQSTLQVLGAAIPSSIGCPGCSGNSGFSLLSPLGINVGGNKAILNTAAPIKLIASPQGSVILDNKNVVGTAQTIEAAMAASGILLLRSNAGLTTGPVLNAFANGNSVTLDATGPSAVLNLNYNVTFGSSVKLMPSGTGSISQNINIFPSVIGGGAAFVGNASMTGNISGPLSVDVTSLTVNSDPATTSNTYNILAVGDISLVFNTGANLILSAGPTTIIADSSATSPQLTISGPVTVNPLVTLTTLATGSSINATAFINNGTVVFPNGGSITASGNIGGNGFYQAGLNGLLTLTSSGGNIGSSFSPLNVGSTSSGLVQLNLLANATANTSGNGNVWLTDADPDVSPLQPAILLNGNAGSGTPVDATTGNFTMIETVGSIGLHPVNLTASSQVSFDAFTNIVQLHGETLVSPSIVLIARTGTIGLNSSLPYLTQASSIIAEAKNGIWLKNSGSLSLTANTLNGSVTIINLGNVTLKDSGPQTNSAPTSYSLVTGVDGSGNGEILIAGLVSSETINLTSTSSGTGAGGIQRVGATGVLNGTNANLFDTGSSSTLHSQDIGSSGLPLISQEAALSAQTNGEIDINNDSSGITLTLTGISGRSVSIQNISSVQVNGPLSATQDFSLSTTPAISGDGFIFVTASINAGTTLHLQSSENNFLSIGGISGSGTLRAATIELLDGTLGTGSGNIFGVNSLDGLKTVATNLQVATSGIVNLSNTGSVNLTTSSAGSPTGGSFILRTTPDAAGNGQIVLSGDLTVSGSNSTALLNSSESGSGTGGITYNAAGSKITAVNVQLMDGDGFGSGDLGSLASRIVINSTNFSVQTKGNVFASSIGGSVNITGAANSAAKFDLSGVSISIDSSLQAHSIILTASATIGLGGNIQALPYASGNGGSLTLSASDIINPFGTLIIGADAIGVSGKGGTVSVTTDTFSHPFFGATIFSANGSGSGDGGSISFQSSGNIVLDNFLSLRATGNNGGQVSVNTGGGGGNITFNSGSVSVNPTGANGNGGSISFDADPGNIIFGNSSSLSANGNGNGAGGSISLKFNSLSYAGSGSGPLILTARSEFTSGIAGTVNITANGLIALGGGPSQIMAVATGGGLVDSVTHAPLNGVNVSSITGDINVLSGGIDVGGGANTNGGNTSLSSTAGNIDLGVGSAISASGTGTGAGGTISINSLTLTYANSLTSPLSLSASAGTLSSNAGSIKLTQASNLVIGNAAGQIQLVAQGAGLIDSASGLPLNGVDVQAKGSLAVSNAGINVGPGSSPGNANGGNVKLAASTDGIGQGLINFTDTNAPTFNGASGPNAGTNGNGTGRGGYIFLSAANSTASISSITYANSGNLPLVLSANGGTSGSAGGDGGFVSYLANGVGQLQTSTGPNGLQINATGGAANTTSVANGGKVFIEFGSSIKINPAAISAGPLGTNGNGANITIKAGFYNGIDQLSDANLLVSSALSANGKGSGAGGSITLEATNTSPFRIGLVAASNANGVQGAVTVSRGNTSSSTNGQVTFISQAGSGTGGVETSVALTAVSTATILSQGPISIGAPIGSTSNSSANANTSQITLSATGGNLTQTKTSAIVSATNLVLQAPSGSIANIGTSKVAFAIATGSGAAILAAQASGFLNISNTGKGTLTVGSIGLAQSTAGTGFTLSTAGNLSTNDTISTSAAVASTIALTAKGSIVIGAGISTNQLASSTIKLTSTGSITDANAAPATYALSTGTVLLNAGSAAIGGTTPQTALRVLTNFLTATTTNAVNISDDVSSLLNNTVTLNSANSKSSFTLTALGGDIINQAVMTTETAINFSTTNNGNIVLGKTTGLATKTNVSLSPNGSGVISLNPTSVILAGKNITLTSTAPIGGASALKLNVSGTLIATSGDLVNIQNTGAAAVTLASSSAGTTFQFSSAGTFSTAGNIEGSAITLTGKGITIGNSSIVGGASTNSVALNVTGSGSINGSSTGVVIANSGITPNVSLSSGSGPIGSAILALAINTPQVTVSTTGLVNLNNTGSSQIALLLGGVSPKGALTLSSASTIQTTQAISTPRSITFATTGNDGGIILAASLGQAKTSTINLTTVGTGALILDSGTILASSINLNTGSNGIGTSLLPFAITASKSVSASSTGVININNLGTTALTLNTSSGGSGALFKLATAGTLTTVGNVIASNNGAVVLQSAGNMTINSTVGGAQANTISLSSSNGSISKGTSTSALVQGQIVSLSGAVNVGAASSAVKINSPSFFSAIAGANGLVNLENTSTGASTLTNSSAGGNFTLKTAGPTTLFDITTTKGNIAVTETAGQLDVGALAIISAGNGSLTLNNTNTTTGKIVIGAGSQLLTTGTGGKNISVIIGATTAVQGSAPTSVTYTVNNNPITPPPIPANTFFFGLNSINVQNAGANTQIQMNVLGGAKVIFNTGTALGSQNKITVNGSLSGPKTIITADPPIGLAASTPSVRAALSPTVQFTAESLIGSPATAASVRTALNPIVQASSSSSSYSSPARLNAQNFLSTNANITGSSAAQPAFQFFPTNSASTSFAATNSAATSSATKHDSDLVWSSETELSLGAIPAAVVSDIDLGIESGVSAGSVSSFAKLTAVKNAEQVRTVAGTSALSGSLSYNTETGRTSLTMNQGSLMFAPSTNSSITTSFGTINVDAGSLVLILSFANGIAVYDFDDLHRAAVNVSAGGQMFQLYPGMNVLITADGVRSFDQINPAQLFAYRNIERHEIGAGLSAFSSEFSLTTALHAVQPLKELLKSNHPNARRLAAHLLKTTAASMQVTGSSRNFQQVLRSATTAWAE